MCVDVGCLVDPPSAALLRPTLWQEHAAIAVLHWFFSEVQPCQPSESPALTLLLKEGQYDKGGRTKSAPPAGCCTFLFLPAPQGYTRPDQTSRLDSQWLALSLPCALPLSIPSFCCSFGVDGALLNSSSCSLRPWGLQLGNTVGG